MFLCEYYSSELSRGLRLPVRLSDESSVQFFFFVCSTAHACNMHRVHGVCPSYTGRCRVAGEVGGFRLGLPSLPLCLPGNEALSLFTRILSDTHMRSVSLRWVHPCVWVCLRAVFWCVFLYAMCLLIYMERSVFSLLCVCVCVYLPSCVLRLWIFCCQVSSAASTSSSSSFLSFPSLWPEGGGEERRYIKYIFHYRKYKQYMFKSVWKAEWQNNCRREKKQKWNNSVGRVNLL